MLGEGVRPFVLILETPASGGVETVFVPSKHELNDGSGFGAL